MALGCAIPVSSAAGESQQAGNGEVTVRDQGGLAVELLPGLTLAQLATLLNTTPAELIAQIEALPGNAEVAGLLNELLANPNAKLEDVINALVAHGLNPAAVWQLINSQLGPALESSERVLGVVDTSIDDLGIDGALPAIASQLTLATGTLLNPHFVPSTIEQVANSLGTTIERLSGPLISAGALTQPLTQSTPVVASPVEASVATRTTRLLGLPNGAGGVTLTTVSSTGKAGPAGPTGSSAARTSISNAFSILSIKVTRSGLIVETVRLPGPGRLAITATARKKIATKVRRGRSKTVIKTASVASIAANTAGGIRTVTLHPRGLANAAKPIQVRLATTYTPTGGSANTKQSSVTLKNVAQKKGGRRR
jgi:hypothetical protein